MEPVPVTGFAANFSPMPRMDPPPLGIEMAGGVIWNERWGVSLPLASFSLASGTATPKPVQSAGNEECLNGKDGSRGIYLSRHGKFNASSLYRKLKWMDFPGRQIEFIYRRKMTYLRPKRRIKRTPCWRMSPSNCTDP